MEDSTSQIKTTIGDLNNRLDQEETIWTWSKGFFTEPVI